MPLLCFPSSAAQRVDWTWTPQLWWRFSGSLCLGLPPWDTDHTRHPAEKKISLRILGGIHTPMWKSKYHFQWEVQNAFSQIISITHTPSYITNPYFNILWQVRLHVCTLAYISMYINTQKHIFSHKHTNMYTQEAFKIIVDHFIGIPSIREGDNYTGTI